MSTERSGIPMPPRRILTRLVIPVALLGGALAALAVTSWRGLLPAEEVDVLPVSMRPAALPPGEGLRAGTESAEGAPIQAPGWVEPSPFPMMVQALTPGVVRTVAVLEGDRVERDQVLLELVDDEHRIALRLAEAALAEAMARKLEMEDELARKSRLVDSGAASQGEVARLRLRAEAMAAAAAGATAERDMKALALERTKVRAPAAGVVMARLAVPGMPAGSMQDGKPLVELYDPASLQVRADVPLADAGRIAVGDRAEIAVDALPNRTLRGEVIRVVHQADIAKNTVQAKVRVLDDAPGLRPEMLARVRIRPRLGGAVAGMTRAASRTQAWADVRCIDARSGAPRALVVGGLQDGAGTLEARTLEIEGGPVGGRVHVASGLRAGDLLVVDPAAAPPAGTRVRIREPWRQAAAEEARDGRD